ncbi:MULTISPECIES: hypothetical protein [unclassified Parabacteroides]|uniref:hypothetical protein n=1 Tax=unclassified Parabacteroides TaxID=2649774 RepID=UPI002473AFA9|nr:MULTISPECIES: hypothetical protein [unclassified Parabacteroides]
MKLRLSDGEIICVLPADNEPFEKGLWDKKKVKISGMLSESKLSRKTIAVNYEEKKLLCHIDQTPCLDTQWAENRWKDGSAENLLNRDNEKLQKKMHETKVNFIQVFSITAKNIIEI